QELKIAAAIAYLSINEMDKVSIYAVRDDKIEDVVLNLLGKDSYIASVDKLNQVVFDGDFRLTEALLPSTVGYGDGMSVIISDFLTDNNFEDAIDYLVSKKRDVLCIQVLSKEELNPQIRGKMHLFDSENSLNFYRKNINKDIINAYKKALEYSTDRVRDFCASRGAGYMLVSAEESVYKIFFDRFVAMGVLK
ncbi:MAG: hypothetical protein K2N33_03415, partial [Clostridia bacterium]|nr:hypothetical protein [Clostridia bacterium]